MSTITSEARLRAGSGTATYPEDLLTVEVGARIWFDGERKAYRVQARDSRFLVCTKPFNLRGTVLYTVIDLRQGVRGTEDLIFGMGAETREQCEEMLLRLSSGDSAVSWRNRIALHVTRAGA